jgi:hypothetical protein
VTTKGPWQWLAAFPGQGERLPELMGEDLGGIQNVVGIEDVSDRLRHRDLHRVERHR